MIMQTHPPKMFLHSCKMSAFNYCLSESTNIMPQAGSLWHKANISTAIYFSLIKDMTQITYNVFNFYVFPFRRWPRAMLSAPESMTENEKMFSRLPVTLTVTPFICSTNTLYLYAHLAFLFLRIAVLVRTWQHHALCWRGWNRRMLEQLSLIRSIHTVWKTNSVYKNLAFHFKKQKQYCF